MSKLSRSTEGVSSGQLKKELNDATSAIQVVRSHIESIERNLVDSQQACANEKALTGKILELETKVEQLNAQNRHDQDAFATAVTKLDLNFGTRVKNHKDELENKLREEAHRFAAAKRELQEQLDVSKRECQNLRKTEEILRRQQETLVEQRKTLVKDMEIARKAEVESWKSKTNEAEAKLVAMNKEVDEQAVMLKGRDTEIGRLQVKLASFQKFLELSPERCSSRQLKCLRIC